ncbi:MAG: HNH endonuclease signature motif containing protein [Candidatus Bathyarchaeota archaeon]|nr:HNH endonuclease signature motif containing protein [Candidatus Bathyarchaeota archaeon]
MKTKVMSLFSDDKKERKKILKADEMNVLERQKHRCAMCQKPLTVGKYHIDHKKPLADGGSNDPRNLEALCPGCHDEKSKKDSAKRAKAKRREKERDPLGTVLRPPKIKIPKFKL